jgi:hypothetical protein
MAKKAKPRSRARMELAVKAEIDARVWVVAAISLNAPLDVPDRLLRHHHDVGLVELPPQISA